MTSKIVVNNIESDAGVSTVFFNSDIGGTGGTLNVDGNLNVDGVLSYEDVTNIDSVGIITARSGINVTSGNVDIGGATHSRNLTVHDATNGVILIEGASNGTSNLMFADENDEDVGMLGYNHASNYLALTVNAAERLRITSGGKLEVYKGTAATGKTSGSEAFTVGNGANNKRFSVYPDGSTVIGGQGTIGNYNILLQNDGTIITASGMQAASVNLQSSSTASWFQTGANYGGTNYVWAAKDSSANVWHSGLQTDGDLLLGGNITGTSYIKLNGSTGNATFIGKVDIGNQYTGGEIFKLGKSSGTSYTGYYNGGTAHGFIGYADQLVASGSTTDFAIRATNNLVFSTNGNNERLRISNTGEVSISGARSGQNISDAILKFNIVNSNGDSKKAEIKSNKVSDISSDLIFSTTSSHTFAERFRISHHGRVGVNDNTDGYAEALQVKSLSSYNQYCLALKIQNNSGTLVRFANGTTAPCGTITSSGGNSTSYNTSSSDSRLKKNFETWDEEVLPHFKSLQPKKFNFTSEVDGTEKTKGFVAQDNVSNFPEAYPLTDNPETNETRYMYNPSGMVIYLMKALQEEIAKREALEARIAALEGS